MSALNITNCQTSFGGVVDHLIRALAHDGSNCDTTTFANFTQTCAPLGPSYNFTLGYTLLDTFCNSKPLPAIPNLGSNMTCGEALIPISQGLSNTMYPLKIQTVCTYENDFHVLATACAPGLDFQVGGALDRLADACKAHRTTTYIYIGVSVTLSI
ncbi:UNVERIFIED_CONTAM: hypothetical protein HDU68_007012, partial [Siphonaria sp. JEL0065]